MQRELSIDEQSIEKADGYTKQETISFLGRGNTLLREKYFQTSSCQSNNNNLQIDINMISIRLTLEQLNKLKEIAHKKGLLVEQYIRLLVINAIKLNNEE